MCTIQSVVWPIIFPFKHRLNHTKADCVYYAKLIDDNLLNIPAVAENYHVLVQIVAYASCKYIPLGCHTSYFPGSSGHLQGGSGVHTVSKLVVSSCDSASCCTLNCSGVILGFGISFGRHFLISLAFSFSSVFVFLYCRYYVKVNNIKMFTVLINMFYS